MCETLQWLPWTALSVSIFQIPIPSSIQDKGQNFVVLFWIKLILSLVSKWKFSKWSSSSHLEFKYCFLPFYLFGSNTYPIPSSFLQTGFKSFTAFVVPTPILIYLCNMIFYFLSRAFIRPVWASEYLSFRVISCTVQWGGSLAMYITVMCRSWLKSFWNMWQIILYANGDTSLHFLNFPRLFCKYFLS